MPNNFAVIGVAGYVAPRHLNAIRNTGNRLVAAVDPHDSVGILDQYEPSARFFTEIERFDRHLEKLRRGPEENRVHYVSICSPNYLHDAHCRLALRVGAHAICEKPLVINPWNLDPLAELEQETGNRISTILQLRVHPKLVQLRQDLATSTSPRQHDVCLTYITARGRWYHTAWKGSQEKSGGVAMNIGIHFFDLLMWLFGPVVDSVVFCSTDRRMSGYLELERARVRWYLSLDAADLPIPVGARPVSTFRSMTIDGEEIDFTDGFTDLHTRVYEGILAGGGYGIDDARPSIRLVHRIRTSTVAAINGIAHPFLTRGPLTTVNSR
jgi:UDP-N-acetyl-2-amino-2-deoxyglucuronate dehydrogenase